MKISWNCLTSQPLIRRILYKKAYAEGFVLYVQQSRINIANEIWLRSPNLILALGLQNTSTTRIVFSKLIIEIRSEEEENAENRKHYEGTCHQKWFGYT